MVTMSGFASQMAVDGMGVCLLVVRDTIIFLSLQWLRQLMSQFTDRYAQANSADLDQTAPSGFRSAQFAIHSAFYQTFL